MAKFFNLFFVSFFAFCLLINSGTFKKSNFILISTAVASETVEGAKKDLAAFKQDLHQKLETLDTEMQKLREQAKQKGQDVKSKTVTELESARNQLKTKIDQLQASSHKNWEKVKTNLSESYQKLSDRVHSALKD